MERLFLNILMVDINYIDKHLGILFDRYLLKFVIAIIIGFAGFVFATVSSKIVKSYINKINPVASTIVSNIVYVFIIIIAVTMVLSRLGLHTSSVIAILGSAGIAVGLAFQPSLSNISSGMMIIIFRLFKIDDLVKIDNFTGNVKDIGLFSTKILTPDNKTIILPNSKITSSNIINCSDEKLRRIDLFLTVEYGQNFDLIKSTINSIILSNDKVLKQKETSVVVDKINEYGFVVAARLWVLKEDYFDVSYIINENIIKEFNKNNIHFAVRKI